MTRLRGLLAAVATGVLLAAPVAYAQQTHVLIISGLGGEQLYSGMFRTVSLAVHKAARDNWGVQPASLIYLSEETANTPEARARSTREEIQKAFAELGSRAAPGDVVLVFLVGHGSGEGLDSRINVPGPDPTAADYAMWLSGFQRQSVVFVNASSASGDFARHLAAPGRIVVTATRSAFERNESVFALFFAQGLASLDADADKDGRVSVLEAFNFANAEVVKHYETANKLRTEHAVLTDSILARSVAFGGSAASSDPRVAALVAERRALEEELARLRERKAQMDEAAYERELERLLVAIAEKSAAIRAAGGRE